MLALAGERTYVSDGKTRIATERFAKTKELFTQVKGRGEWNRNQVDAIGNHVRISINEVLINDVTDNGTTQSTRSGIIAFQLHVGKTTMLQLKNIQMTKQIP